MRRPEPAGPTPGNVHGTGKRAEVHDRAIVVLGEIHNDRHRGRVFVAGHERTANPLSVSRQLLPRVWPTLHENHRVARKRLAQDQIA